MTDPTRWTDDLAERLAIMESEGVPDAAEKAAADIEACRERERPQAGLFREAM